MYDLYLKINLLNLYVKISSYEETRITFFKNKVHSIPSLHIVNIPINADITIKITEDCIEVIESSLRLSWKGHISSSDSFVLINALFYHLFYLKGFICIHANAIITNREEVVLIAGDFGAGKSTLCHLSQEKGYKVCAGDQAVIELNNNQLYFISGSTIDKFNGSLNLLDYNFCNKIYPIAQIIILNGMCDNGNLSVEKLTDVNLISKRISNYLFWPYYTPCMSLDDKSFIKLYPQNMTIYNEFWTAIDNLKLYRGDKRKIFEDIVKC